MDFKRAVFENWPLELIGNLTFFRPSCALIPFEAKKAKTGREEMYLRHKVVCIIRIYLAMFAFSRLFNIYFPQISNPFAHHRSPHRHSS